MSEYDVNMPSAAQLNADVTDNLTAKQDAALLSSVYQSVSMGAGAMEHMMKVTKDKNLREQFTREMKDYLAIEAAALGRLHRLHESPEDVGTMTRLMSGAGIRLNSALDSSPGHLAQMAANTAQTGISETRGALNSNPHASDEAKRIAEAVINLEQKNLEELGNFIP